MTITTLDDSMAANGSAATLTVYGEKGKTKDIELKKDGAFEPGNVDEFDDVSCSVCSYQFRMDSSGFLCSVYC